MEGTERKDIIQYLVWMVTREKGSHDEKRARTAVV